MFKKLKILMMMAVFILNQFFLPFFSFIISLLKEKKMSSTYDVDIFDVGNGKKSNYHRDHTNSMLTDKN